MVIDSSVNRFARAFDFPSLTTPDNIGLVTVVQAPGTDFTNSTYNGMNGLGMTLRQRAGLGDLTVFSDYFTSANYYLGYLVLAGLGYALFSSLGGKSGRRRAARKAALAGRLAQTQQALKDA